MRFLLGKKGVNFVLQHKIDWKLVFKAVENGHEAVVKLLLEKGANLSQKMTMAIFFGPRKIGGTKENRFDSSTLNKRAWVKQKRILSGHILHFSSGMVFWECDDAFEAANGSSVFTSRTLPVRVELLTVALESSIAAESYEFVGMPPPEQGSESFWEMFMRVTDIWSTIITHYNTCALTYRRDKLPVDFGINGA